MALHLNHKIISMLLQISVVGLGFGINFESALKAGNDGFVKSVGWPAIIAANFNMECHFDWDIIHVMSAA